MKIISHRGLWTSPEEKNTAGAFRCTIDAGFGTETDVRDAGGQLVVSHDPVVGPAMAWNELLDAFDGRGLPLAVNIKSDGLVPMLAQAFEGRDLEWFAFDMSGPQAFQFARAKLPFYTRHSDIEPAPILYEESCGVWLDAFSATWFGIDDIAVHHAAGKAVCVVSSELHGRPPEDLWTMLRAVPNEWDVTLCTDKPEAAQGFFSR